MATPSGGGPVTPTGGRGAAPAGGPAPAAVVFDNDGTLLDTFDRNLGAWRAAAATEGITVSAAWYRTRVGLSAEMVLDALEREAGRPIAREAVLARQRETGEALLHLATPVDRVVRIARALHGRVPLAVCSGAPRGQVHSLLEAAGLLGLFDIVVAAEDAGRPKPAPDLYLHTARLLGVPPSRCTAFEDSAEGTAAARAAGMAVVDVTDPVAVAAAERALLDAPAGAPEAGGT